jgi:hypothetical protein
MTLEECTIPNLEKIFGLKLRDESEYLSAWINQNQALTSFQQEALFLSKRIES